VATFSGRTYLTSLLSYVGRTTSQSSPQERIQGKRCAVVSQITGERDIDAVISPAEKQDWIKDPGGFNRADRSAPKRLSDSADKMYCTGCESSKLTRLLLIFWGSAVVRGSGCLRWQWVLSSPRTLPLPGTSLTAATGAIPPGHPPSFGINKRHSLSGCEHRIYLRPMQCHLNHLCAECIRQVGRFCLNVCDVFRVGQQSRIQRFSGNSDLGPGGTKAIPIGVIDLLQLGLFVIG